MEFQEAEKVTGRMTGKGEESPNLRCKDMRHLSQVFYRALFNSAPYVHQVYEASSSLCLHSARRKLVLTEVQGGGSASIIPA